jgi:hypothetical protein
MKAGDILLIEGRNHISGIIKYLSQSTWSHAALYVRPIAGRATVDGRPCDMVESNLDNGIIDVPLSKYFPFHTRICRPVGLSSEDRQAVCDYAIERIGLQYDLKTAAGAAALAAEHDRAWFGRSVPAITRVESESARQEIYHIRDSLLYTPRDFDISPYFAVIKPTIETGFNYKTIKWSTDDGG